MALTGFQSFSLSVFGWISRPLTKENYKLKETLIKARIQQLPEAYVAQAIMSVFLTFVCTSMLVLLVIGIGIPMIEDVTAQNDPEGVGVVVPERVKYVLLAVGGVVLPLFVAFFLWIDPSSKAGKRGKEMERNLPFVASYIAALAASNATPSVAFKSLARNEDIYGEVSKDAAWIYSSIEYMGRDLVTTLKDAVDRSPSEKFAEFLQGMVGTITSGGNLKLYFLNRAEYYAQLNRNYVKDVINKMALFAESYVVVAVALPIFVMIIMVITFWVSGSGMQVSESMLYMIVFGLLPLIQGGFTILFKGLSDEITV